MARLQLRIYLNPSEAQVFCNVLRKDGNQEPLTAVIDTGAAVSLLPEGLLAVIVYRPTRPEKVLIEQAGIAKQSFQAVEAYVTVSLEDEFGNVTQPFEVLAWFTDTETPLIGFEGILDRAVLHLDMPRRNGWLEIDV